MLDRCKVPKEDIVKVEHESLKETVTQIFEKMGILPEDAKEGADVLVSTDLRGVETHGVSNMLRSYVERYNAGDLNPRPDWKIERESQGTATIDADSGLAVILGPKAMRIAIDKAKNVGIGVVTMHNAGHSGAIGHHAMLAAKEDMIGMTATAGGMSVLPTFGAEPRLGTNPIAIAAPARNNPPFLFDAATSAIAGNKLGLAARVGANLLPNWISGLDGAPIGDEVPMPDRGEFHQLPLGGTREQGSHKGYGFGLMSEILATGLSGAVSAMVIGSGKTSRTGGTSCHYFCAYNIEAFTDVEIFKDNMDNMLQSLKDTPPAPGHERVMYPGLSESEEEEDRKINGIPLHSEVVEWFTDITSELTIPMVKIL